MQYAYSDKYGSEQPCRLKRLKDRHGDEIPWQYEHDNAVDKALLQVMKEDKMSFARLLAVLRKETVRDMHSMDRWRIPAYQQLDKYKGSSRYSTLSQYWVEQLAYAQHKE